MQLKFITMRFAKISCTAKSANTKPSTRPLRRAKLFMREYVVSVTKCPAKPILYRLVKPNFLERAGKKSMEDIPSMIPEVLMMKPIWKLERFRPPRDIGLAYKSGNMELDADSMKTVKA